MWRLELGALSENCVAVCISPAILYLTKQSFSDYDQIVINQPSKNHNRCHAGISRHLHLGSDMTKVGIFYCQFNNYK
jgi:hypothetical protein